MKDARFSTDGFKWSRVGFLMTAIVIVNLIILPSTQASANFPGMTGRWFWLGLISAFTFVFLPTKKATKSKFKSSTLAFAISLPFVVLISIEGLGAFLNERLDQSEGEPRACRFEGADFYMAKTSGDRVRFSDCPNFRGKLASQANVGDQFNVNVKPGFFGREWIQRIEPR